MEKIKLCYLVEDLKRGGMENVVASMARGLNKDKYDVAVWCIVAGGEVADELSGAGIKVRVLNIHTYHNPLNILKLAIALRSGKFDVLHSHGYFSSTAGRFAGILAGVPILIAHVHTIFYNMNKRNIAIDKFLNRFTYKIIFISQTVKESFIKEGYSFGDKAEVVYNGVKDASFSKVSFESEKKILINVASHYVHKGQTYLLKAMKDVLVQFPQAILWMVGDGPLKKDLEKEVMELGLTGHVVFWGRRNDVRQLLAQAHVFILPSLREGIPLSIIEAMAAGLPVVATRVGGIEEMVAEQESGVLLPSGDVKALALGIISLLGDQQKCVIMGQAGRRIFEEKFTVSRMLNSLETIYGSR